MAKNLRQQRRGRKQSLRYRSPGHRFVGKVSYRSYDEMETKGKIAGRVVDIIHDPARSAPLAVMQYETGEMILIPAPTGLRAGQVVETGAQAKPVAGNVLPLVSMPEGTPIYNIEIVPGDGGKVIRSSGSSGTLVSKKAGKATIRLPSGTLKQIDSRCRAAVGIIAGAGRRDKPLMKAGASHHKMKARNHYWPIVAGMSKNACDHPFGGGSHRRSIKSKTRSHSSPPGQKVGSIAARRTGRRR